MGRKTVSNNKWAGNMAGFAKLGKTSPPVNLEMSSELLEDFCSLAKHQIYFSILETVRGTTVSFLKKNSDSSFAVAFPGTIQNRIFRVKAFLEADINALFGEMTFDFISYYESLLSEGSISEFFSSFPSFRKKSFSHSFKPELQSEDLVTVANQPCGPSAQVPTKQATLNKTLEVSEKTFLVADGDWFFFLVEHWKWYLATLGFSDARIHSIILSGSIQEMRFSIDSTSCTFYLNRLQERLVRQQHNRTHCVSNWVAIAISSN